MSHDDEWSYVEPGSRPWERDDHYACAELLARTLIEACEELARKTAIWGERPSEVRNERDALRAQVATLIAERDEARGEAERGWTEVARLGDELREARLRLGAPIPMYLTCPKCNARHIDEGEFATKVHHTHSCQSCGLTWRPAVVATVGVAFLPGFKSEPALAAAESEAKRCDDCDPSFGCFDGSRECQKRPAESEAKR